MLHTNSTPNGLVEVTCAETARTMKVATKDLKRFCIENPTYVETSKIEAPAETEPEAEAEADAENEDTDTSEE